MSEETDMLPATLVQALHACLTEAPDPSAAVNALRSAIHDLSPTADMPVDFVRWVPVEQVEPNDYNPNAVAAIEMGLLLKSIEADGYTQPVVTIWHPEKQKYVVVDGFHRYYLMKTQASLRSRTGGRLPIVVIEKSISDRMASTVRHNRARGKHSVAGMANMVLAMLDAGMGDAAICNELGMEEEELVRLKHVTGFSKLFADVEYKRAWVSRNQVLAKVAQSGTGFSEAKEPTTEG
jgi:ParB-like chromosome segregation protein Spo0J